jgi:hypothetical protein
VGGDLRAAGRRGGAHAAIATNELRMKVSEQLALRDYWATSH